VGSGPAGIACATFLSRFGYRNIHLYERKGYLGGLSASEIPQYRLAASAVSFEADLMSDLGAVTVHLNKDIGGAEIPSLSAMPEVKAGGMCFASVGLPSAKGDSCFDGLTTAQGYFTSKDFLPPTCEAAKKYPCSGCAGSTPSASVPALPSLYGKVLVFGCGDTAFDCTGSAFRCGASRVIVTFRRTFADMKCVDEEFEMARMERCEFLPYCSPKRAILDPKTGRIVAMELAKMEFDPATKAYFQDNDQTLTIKCDFVITAFGSKVSNDLQKALAPLTFNKSGNAEVDKLTMQSKTAPWLFAGGDLVGSGLTVEATNDGKQAAWHIHAQIQKIDRATKPTLPLFYTEIDEVDLSIEFCGMKFLNPFGIASATGATSAAMIARSFDEGWAFAVTKTFCLDKDFVTNISPRIVRGTTSGATYGPHQSSFLNIEVISEKSMSYWLTGIRQLKKDYPAHIVIASIMCAYDEADWKELAILSKQFGADGLELNLSCPHGMGEKGMGLACGQDTKMVRDISRWVREVIGPDFPLFTKMTPNITCITHIAQAAMEGGATGVTAINTVSGLMGVRQSGFAWPAVGKQGLTTYGGVSGNATRPMALKAISSIANKLPGTPIMGAGGIDTADIALQFLMCGASIVQVCSAVQNQDFSVIQDYLMGLKTYLYMKSRPDLREWEGMQPPYTAPPLQTGTTPHFGAENMEKIARKPEELNVRVPRVPSDAPVPKIKDVIGKALDHITNWSNLDPKQPAIAVVNDDLCINCGRCYLTCNDSGYQAILFSKDTHQPIITEDCTGCTLCVSVCPVPDCITMVPRTSTYEPKRGTPIGSVPLPVGARVKIDL
jgi:dihydropyrimidine dehydrogenase (NADP+)